MECDGTLQGILGICTFCGKDRQQPFDVWYVLTTLQGVQTGFSSNGARFFSLVFLFLILSCLKRVLVGGIVMRGCASSLLGSYIHQESILNNVNDTNVYSCV